MRSNIFAAMVALFLMAAGIASAETAPAPAGGPGPQRGADCSRAADPANCKEKRTAMREHIAEAKSACAGKQGEERHQCVTDNLCAKSADPRKCQENAKARAAHRPQALQACAGKRGPEHRECMREEYRKLAPAK
jgi:hypothetical protein